jgi:hypothetical protein
MTSTLQRPLASFRIVSPMRAAHSAGATEMEIDSILPRLILIDDEGDRAGFPDRFPLTTRQTFPRG